MDDEDVDEGRWMMRMLIDGGRRVMRMLMSGEGLV